MKQLSRDDRLRLMRFVCSFAWSDLRVSDEERAAIRALVDRLRLDQDERITIARWLAVPPDDVDPAEIPPEHRQMFVDEIRALLESDGVTVAEHDVFRIFEEILA